MDIYTEILYRLHTTKGLAWTTFRYIFEIKTSVLAPEVGVCTMIIYPRGAAQGAGHTRAAPGLAVAAHAIPSH
jgi:hypothetical protein